MAKLLLEKGTGGGLKLDLAMPQLKLPEVLNQTGVLLILKSIENIKHRMILVLTYSAGLRVGEVVRLKLEDIDKERNVIHIRQAKGRKDRYTVLSQVAWDYLNVYLKKYQPDVWLFAGARSGTHLSECSVQHIFERAVLANDKIFLRLANQARERGEDPF